MGLIETIADIAVPQAALPLRLLSWGTWLLAHPMTAIALLAAIFGAVEHHEADKWAKLARQRAATLTAIQTANTSSTQQATAAKEAKDAHNAKLAVQSDQTAADLRGRYHAAVLRFAAAQNRARSADLRGDADAAARGDGPGDGSGVPAGAGPANVNSAEPADPLTIGRDDALTCADNTGRLQAVHDWAVALGQ